MSLPPYRLMPPTALDLNLSPVDEECIGMGITAENLQKMYAIPRDASDTFAYNSQMRSKAAWEAGYFKDEIIPVTIPGGKKKPDVVFDTDEHPRFDTTLEGLAALKPAFAKDGTVTAGNASGRNDGSAFVLMMSEDKAKELGYEPMARWVCGADYGVDPKIMGIGPAYAMAQAIGRAGLTLSDMAVMECNEAFAVQNLAVIKELENQTGGTVNMEDWNPLGGAIAYGHPNGASGARICMFTMRELIRRKGRYGIFSSCCGGGLGVATLIENLNH
jgi:acetyl-CoA C-acetyltransferase